MKTLACLFAVVGIANSAAAYSPIIDGAMADVRIKVVDDMGEVVPDATISVTFYTAPDKVDVKRGTTDTQGCFSAKGRCIGDTHGFARMVSTKQRRTQSLESYPTKRRSSSASGRMVRLRRLPS